MTTLRRPLHDVSFTEVLVRVGFQLVMRRYRRTAPWHDKHPPTEVFALAEQLRRYGYVNLYWTLNGCARWLAAGYTLGAWRDQAPTATGLRAFHKSTAPRRRR